MDKVELTLEVVEPNMGVAVQHLITKEHNVKSNLEQTGCGSHTGATMYLAL